MGTKTINDLDPAVRAELHNIKELIVNAVPDWIEQIYLFGSYAYGTPHKDSDLDLYVVLKNDVTESNLHAGIQIRMATHRKRTMPIDVVTMKKEMFDRRLNDITLEQQVAEEGILIYG